MDIKKPVMAIIQVSCKVFFYKYSQPSSQTIKGSKRDLRAIDIPEKREVADVLTKVTEYWNQHANGGDNEELQKLDEEFVKLHKNMLFEVIMATIVSQCKAIARSNLLILD
ncbi:hypothetical protein C4D60_Mb11t05580 [Musa balbisiana]|uniref:SKP1 component POZ domain-containing protein n=1 Tax=Musa balbisiana TaxID=52838 RepID=A0A4S8J3G1_MUSBA|nr:hypothetical protein C4D60_Mb11t05580 [Musa balbisiana]